MMGRPTTRGVPVAGDRAVPPTVQPSAATPKGDGGGCQDWRTRRRSGPARVKGGKWSMSMVVDWPSIAACRNGDPDALFVQGAEQNVAKRICRSCPVRYECLADALDNRIEFGVWGGMTERERRALLRRHPQVPSWRKMFEAAMDRNEKDAPKELVPTG